MLNHRLICDYLYGKEHFTWLSLMMSLMASFVLSFFRRDVLDEIWDLIESVSEVVFLPTLTVHLYVRAMKLHQNETRDHAYNRQRVIEKEPIQSIASRVRRNTVRN